MGDYQVKRRLGALLNTSCRSADPAAVGRGESQLMRRAASAELIGDPFATERSRRWSVSSAVCRAAAFARGSSTSSAARARSSSDSSMFSCDSDAGFAAVSPAPSSGVIGSRPESNVCVDKVDLAVTPADVRLRRILSC